MRHQFLQGTLGVALCGLALVGSAADAKPNVLFIISDDLRTELGCYGSPLAKTPNIDALAAAGVRFDRAYCQFPLCNPSRSSMLTGRYPATTGVVGNRSWFGREHPEFISLPRYFREHGYWTLRAGKIFHGGIDDAGAWREGGDARIYGDATLSQREAQRPATPAERSDRSDALPGDGRGRGDDRTAAVAIDYLQRYSDKPFFLACGFSKPHSPLRAPRRFVDLYDLLSISLPVNFAPRPTVPDGFPTRSIRPKNADLFVGRDASPEEAKEMIRAYLASVSWMDENVGRVLDELDRLRLRDNTIVVFWGDHGYQLGERGKWSKAGSLFEQGARVPLIIDAPSAAGNGRPSPRVVQSIDIYPTLVELCDLPQPAGVEGRSLVPLLENPAAPRDHPAYTVWSEDGRTFTGVSVRDERWRYAEFDDGRGGAMLFDEDADPQELKNLADDPKYQDVRAKLSKLVREHAAPHQDE
jgi:iduronate 2-sulfatase